MRLILHCSEPKEKVGEQIHNCGLSFDNIPPAAGLNFRAVASPKNHTPARIHLKQLTDIFTLSGAFLITPRGKFVSLDIFCLTVAISSQPASLCIHICSLTFESPCDFSPEVSELYFHSAGQQD